MVFHCAFDPPAGPKTPQAGHFYASFNLHPHQTQFSNYTEAQSTSGVDAINSAPCSTQGYSLEVKDNLQFDASYPQHLSCVFCG